MNPFDEAIFRNEKPEYQRISLLYPPNDLDIGDSVLYNFINHCDVVIPNIFLEDDTSYLRKDKHENYSLNFVYINNFDFDFGVFKKNKPLSLGVSRQWSDLYKIETIQPHIYNNLIRAMFSDIYKIFEGMELLDFKEQDVDIERYEVDSIDSICLDSMFDSN
ncbi:MAG: hypothetical protein ACQER9_04335 [Nanobdellota archaeon]